MPLCILGSVRPLYFTRPKISQNTHYTGISALYSPITDAGIELSSRVIIAMKIWLMFDRWASLFFSTKILSEDPYLKSFISRVRSKHRERFCSFSRYATRLRVEAFFLPPLHRGARTIAVKTKKRHQKPTMVKIRNRIAQATVKQ